MERRRILKAAVVLVTLGYCSLLVYQGGVTFNSQDNRPDPIQVLIEPTTKATSVNFRNISVDDVFISVKTTKHYEYIRLPIILKTWFQLAKNQTWFFTDTDNSLHQKQTNGHMVNTNCSATHQMLDLCCKLGVEYDYYLESDKKWFCHFDDDNYVNVPRLVKMLQEYDYTKDWYLGRPSVAKPFTIDKLNQYRKNNLFRFATGGAGFCISQSVAYKMLPIASDGKFISVCKRVKYNDDMTMGYIVEQMVNTDMTFVPEFHSHYEPMDMLPAESFKDQISFSYSKNQQQWNVVDVPGFNVRFDPTRFLSLHCFLFPHFEYCPR